MEDFTKIEKKKIKEKNLYILHLDTPRIIIISSVLVGLIIISLLIGMHINKKRAINNNALSEEDAILDTIIADNNKKGDPINDIIESPIENGFDLKNPLEGNNYKSSLSSVKDDLLKNSNVKKYGLTTEDESDKKANAADILTHENIESIIHPPKKIAKPRQKGSGKKREKKYTQKKHKKKKEQRTVEVASRGKKFARPETNRSYYAIQVASYNKKYKAQAEITRLGNMRYDAYLDSTDVRGRTFYRVRIGPIFSKRKALRLLDEIQYNERYEESYMVRE